MKQSTIIILTAAGVLLITLFAVRLSADALGMAVGLVFGVLAGVPTALLVLGTDRRYRPDDDCDDCDARPPQSSQIQQAQPPVIVVMPAQMQQALYRQPAYIVRCDSEEWEQ